jgi:hypothetical protein
MALQPLSTSSKIVVYRDDVELQDKTGINNYQGVTVGDILALSGVPGQPALSGVPGQTSLIAVGTDITTTAELEYKVNKVTANATDYAVKLPEPQLGGTVGVVNSSSVPVYVFPYDADDSIVGLAAGEAYVVPADGQLYNILCVQNPSVGVWSVSTPTSNNSIRKTVSVNLTADGTVNDGGTYSYSAPLLNSNKTTYYPSTGPYDVLNAPLPTNNWFDTAEFNTYNKVRLKNITVKTNVPAGDLTGAVSQRSSALMGLTATQLFQLFGYIRIISLGSNGATYSVNEFNLLRPLDFYSSLVNAGNSTQYASHYMKNGTLYQQLQSAASNNVWQDINDANGNRRIYFSPYIGYGQPGTPYTGYPQGFSFEVELIVEFEFSI